MNRLGGRIGLRGSEPPVDFSSTTAASGGCSPPTNNQKARQRRNQQPACPVHRLQATPTILSP